MISPFTFIGRPARVIFGRGKRVVLAAEVERLGASRVLVISTPEQRGEAEMAADLLGDHAAGIHDRAVPHTPMDTVDVARQVAADLGADCYVTVGGGTAIGLGKGIALESEKPVLALPTTYSGSEMSAVQGFTKDGVKTTRQDDRMLPRTVIYDPELTLGLPASYSGPSGMNAIAHAVEALYAEHANPIVSLIAEEGIHALGKGLPGVCASPDDLEGRSLALYGSWLCGIALGAGGMALHHKLCHVVGGSFHLAHAPTHAIILPHAMAYNAPAAETAMKRVCKALNADNAPGAIYDLIRKIGAPIALKQIGMPEDGLDRAAQLTAQNPYYNPRQITQDGIRQLLDDAFHGRRPAA
ncbi:MAG: maleylacetate reductase [Rhodospirillaceae bacterium]|nr:maleylacetate reductase [Rhodospirillaceae bacterium]